VIRWSRENQRVPGYRENFSVWYEGTTSDGPHSSRDILSASFSSASFSPWSVSKFCRSLTHLNDCRLFIVLHQNTVFYPRFFAGEACWKSPRRIHSAIRVWKWAPNKQANRGNHKSDKESWKSVKKLRSRRITEIGDPAGTFKSDPESLLSHLLAGQYSKRRKRGRIIQGNVPDQTRQTFCAPSVWWNPSSSVIKKQRVFYGELSGNTFRLLLPRFCDMTLIRGHRGFSLWHAISLGTPQTPQTRRCQGQFSLEF